METIVKIKWDQPDEKEWLCADNIQIALSAYCKNTNFKVTDVNLEIPSDEEIQELTLKDAKDRNVICYVGHDKIMKAGMSHIIDSIKNSQ